jgi:WD40 repeat protein
MKKSLPIDILSLRNIIKTGSFAILLLIGITLLSSLFISRISTQDEPEIEANSADNPDMLAYVSADDHLMLYDPRDRTETTLLENVRNFVLSREGRVAFTRLDDTELYVFDPSTPALDPINISQNPDELVYPLGWSPDGRYLAFASFREGSGYSDNIWIAFGSYIAGSRDQSLYVWDGETTTNIMPETTLATANVFFIDWSYDGRLAFTVQHGWSDSDIPSETYVWDGSETTNLSQNPEYWDGVGSWSRSGQLLFASQRDDENGIYVWDGVSFRDGSPDVDSFIRVAPELQLTDATWTDEGFVAFTLYTVTTGTKEITLWDLETREAVRRIPVSSVDSFSRLTEDGQVILSSQLASGLPSYYLDIENTKGEILFSTHTGEFSWSSSGYLAYCEFGEDRNWVLSMWDGEETWAIANVSYRPAQWQNGRDTFSCNSG